MLVFIGVYIGIVTTKSYMYKVWFKDVLSSTLCDT